MKKEFFEISKLLKKNSKVLDVGCGDGELMKYITFKNASQKGLR